MPGKTPRSAVQDFLRPLRRAVSLITRKVLMASGHTPAPEPHTVTFEHSEPAGLNSGAGIQLDFAHRYVILRPTSARPEWRVSSAEYIYELLDRHGTLIVGWHWHPRGRSPATWPHLHVPRASPYDLGRVHPPTGRVSIEAIIAFAIRELGVRPLRADWERELERAERQFIVHRTWH